MTAVGLLLPLGEGPVWGVYGPAVALGEGLGVCARFEIWALTEPLAGLCSLSFVAESEF